MPNHRGGSTRSSYKSTCSTGSYSCSTNLDRSSLYSVAPPKVLPADVIVMRHSERVDDLFPGWTAKANKHGRYSPYDLNMPSSLPVARPLEDYCLDTPITVLGSVLAKMVGRALLMTNLTPDIIYCSPALRCMQTAQAVRNACRSTAKLRVEPALFENPDLYSRMPTLLSKEQRSVLFDIDGSYKQSRRLNDIFTHSGESNEGYNNRVKEALLCISNTVADGFEKAPIVLVVGHASTVDLAVGTLAAADRITQKHDLEHIGDRIPYCCTSVFHRRGALWHCRKDALPPISYRNFSNRPHHAFLFR